jgi:hypothetical protein
VVRARVAAALLAAVVVLAPAAAPGAAAHEVVASNLNNPRKLFVGADGAVYVVEAGTGGRDRCLGTGAQRTCVGLTGAITKLTSSGPRRVVTGLWSGAYPNGTQAEGPADVIVRGRTFDVLLQDASVDAHGRNALGPDGAYGGDLIATPAGKARPATLFNFAAFEAARNPDHGAGPGAKLGNPPIDSDPYALTAYRGGYAVVDAAGNDLLQVTRHGRASVLAVFPTQTQRLSREVAKAIGAPGTMRSISVQSVPSSVAVGPDGALYVGELTGVPFTPGSARVWRVVPGRKPTVYASGFTNISDVAFDGRDLLVLELAAHGLLDRSRAGALIRVSPGGHKTVVASSVLTRPTGVAVAGGWIYVSTNGLSPGRGPGPHGTVVRMRS